MSRIGPAFAALRARGEAALVPYFTAGDPDLATTRELVRAVTLRDGLIATDQRQAA